MSDLWEYDKWAPITGELAEKHWMGLPHDLPAERDCHVDLGCGTVKKGRIGIDHYPAPGVNIVMNLNKLHVHSRAKVPNQDAPLPSGVVRHGTDRKVVPPGEMWVESYGLPFEDSSIESFISHHCLEHIGEGFIPLMDEVYRCLKPGGTIRAITPLFPSLQAVGDPTHVRFFTEDTWMTFGGHLGDENNPTGSWLDSFSVPYTKGRFQLEDQVCTPYDPDDTNDGGWMSTREIRVTLRAVK